MNKLSILLQKEVLLALGAIVFVGAVVASGTGAFFSSQAAAVGNTFTAGTLQLMLTQNQGGGSPEATKSALWNFTNMAPGGTPETSSVWLRNTGSVDGATLGVGIANAWTNPSNIAAQMRITEMTLDGNNLLEGGAGATIPEYEAPTNCTVTLGGSDRITDAIFNASNGDVICATGSNYSAAWETGSSNPFNGSTIVVNKEVAIVSVGGPSVTQVIPFNVTADNVVIKGFTITGPNSTYGVYASDVDNLTVSENHILNIGTALASGSAHGVYLKPTTASMTGASLTFNRVENIGNPALTVSTKGFFVGDTSPSHGIDDVEIKHNIVKTVRTTKGAYGVLVNHGGGTTNLVVENNTISDLDGGWEQGVSLYNNTPSAIVRLNNMSDFAGVVGAATGVNVENNPSASTVVIEKNNFNTSVPTGVLNQTAFNVGAQDNWWGGFTPTGVNVGGGSIDTSNFAGGPFAGLVNGNDANGNGYADLRDLRDDSILGITPGLDAYDGSNDKEFVMSVQLDGPTTGNGFQGLSLENVNIEFTLNQI